MKTTISLTEMDFLINQLFLISSREDYHRKNTQKRFLFPIIFMLLGVLFYFIKFITLFKSMMLLAIVWMMLYPTYKRWFLKRFYAAFISKQYKDSFNVETQYSLNSRSMKIKNQHIDMDIDYKDIQKIIEIPSHFFLIMKNESTIIFPKHQVSGNFIKTLCKKTKLHIEEQLDWKW